jgi:hypothetical protein
MAIKPLVQALRELCPSEQGGELDVEALEARKQRLREMTTTANVGAFAVPLGAKIVRNAKTGAGDIQGNYPLRASGTGKKKRKKFPSYWPV